MVVKLFNDYYKALSDKDGEIFGYYLNTEIIENYDVDGIHFDEKFGRRNLSNSNLLIAFSNFSSSISKCLILF